MLINVFNVVFYAVHLCNIYGDYETHQSLHLQPYTEGHFCAFSIQFSNDNKEILAGWA